MTHLVQPVILCGGSGSRLWPLSRSGYPKQFLCLTGNESLLQKTAQRLVGLSRNSPYKVASLNVISNEEHRFIAQEQLREMGVEDAIFVLEPVGRNTAPALTIAALSAIESGDDPILVVTPADQSIDDVVAFHKAIGHAIDLAILGNIVLLGVTPDKPETGYGYIQVNTSEVRTDLGIEVLRFIEKPDAATAQSYLDDGGYYWNAGVFILKASVWLSAIKFFRSDIADAAQNAWAKRLRDAAVPSFVRPGKAEFANIPSESIDYAVLERSPGSIFSVKMLRLDTVWNDLGAWDSVWKVEPKDKDGNILVGDVFTIDTESTLVHASSRFVGLIGVEGLVVVETPDAVLVARKSRSQDVKHIVSQLQDSNRDEYTLHRKVHRPWGWYDSIDKGERFKVKRIQVKPGASLSMQKHCHRAEHWIVVKGVAEVTNGDQTTFLAENESAYIPLGQIHRLSNPGAIPLEIIEVQSGNYLDEDDIVRFEDNYGRNLK